MLWQPESPALRALLAALTAEIDPVYLVGGVVRDLLLGRSHKPTDLDLLVAHSAIPIARRAADRVGWAFYALDEGRDVARLVFNAGASPLVVDIAAMRGGSLDADLRARDFTVNALALPLRRGPTQSTPEIVDLVGGRTDLQNGLIRRVAATSLADDPLRLLRAVRFSIELDFPIEEQTRDQMLRMPGALAMVSPERHRDELWKMVAGRDPAAAIELLRELGLLPWVLPEVSGCDLVQQSPPHTRDVYRHTLAVVRAAAVLRDWLLGPAARTTAAAPTLPAPLAESLAEVLRALDPWAFYLRRHFAPGVASNHTRAEWLVWHALFHDVGKPSTRTLEPQPDGTQRTRFLGHEDAGVPLTRSRLEALRFSRQEVDLCAAVVRHHMRPHSLNDAFGEQEISRRARYRYFRDIGGADIERPTGIDVLLTALADFLGTRDERPLGHLHQYLVHAAQMLAFVYSERGVEAPALRPLVDGRTLMRDLGIQPGPALGRLIDQLAEAQAAGEIVNPEDALQLARSLVSSAGTV
jgi:tRNA nucleotidyltransferase/poly(A) polymerase